MFFYLAKTIWFFAQPSGLLLLLLLTGAALLVAGRHRLGRRLVVASAGLLLVRASVRANQVTPTMYSPTTAASVRRCWNARWILH